MKFRIFIFLLVASFSGLAQTKDSVIIQGYLENDVYVNEFFGFSLPIPENWSVQNRDQLEMIKSAGEELMGDSKEVKYAQKESAKNTYYLLTIFKYELGTPVDFNPSIIIIGENVSHSPGIKSGVLSL